MENLGRFGHKSLPTYYKGITFRSRLEARWAIVFDELNIAWEYEPEPLSLDFCGSRINYLPDFYLPKVDCFVEVKGHLDDLEFVRLMRIAAAITAPKGGRPHENGGRPFVVLGNLGNKNYLPTPNQLTSYKGLISCNPSPEWFIFQEPNLGLDNYGIYWWDETDDVSEVAGLSKSGLDINYLSNVLCDGDPNHDFEDFHGWGLAMTKARSARFDRGHNV
jgi:hypothetical protein